MNYLVQYVMDAVGYAEEVVAETEKDASEDVLARMAKSHPQSQCVIQKVGRVEVEVVEVAEAVEVVDEKKTEGDAP